MPTTPTPTLAPPRGRPLAACLTLLLLPYHLGSAAAPTYSSQPAFRASPSAKLSETHATCATRWAALAAPYRNLTQVLVVDWHSLGFRGLGDMFHTELRALRAGVASGRATFAARNLPGVCHPPSPACRFDASVFLGAVSDGATGEGLAWEWSSATERAVELAQTALGQPSTPVVFHLTHRAQSAGFVRHDTGATLPGPLAGFAAVLAHPLVRDLPYVRLVVSLVDGPVYDSVEELDEDLWGALTGPPPGELADPCADAFFMFPRRRLQRLLLPPLARLDSARAAGGAVVGLHVRTGYADLASGVAGTQAVPPPPPAPPAPTGRAAWEALDFLHTDCEAVGADAGARPLIHLRSSPAWSEGLVSAAGQTRPGACFWWDAPAKAMVDSGGASCGVPPPWLAAAALGAPHGFVSSLLRCGAAAAANVSAVPAAALLYLAGDLPALHTLVAADPALAAHVVTAGLDAGTIGHVSAAWHRCSGARCSWAEGPGGAWSRTLVDLYMLGATDAVVRTGTSTFVDGAALKRVVRPLAVAVMEGTMWPPWLQSEFRGLLYSLSHALVLGNSSAEVR